MDTREQIQLVLDVIDDKRPMVDLRLVLDEPPEINVFRCAVDHVVGKALEQASGKAAEFRFRLKVRGDETFTPWTPETTQFSAMMAMGQVRAEHPQAEIAIERRY